MQLPGPVRAVVGLFATAADEARHLPDRAIELPMLAVSSALQISLRAQQRYARLAARGDDVINRRPATDEPPPWATFDAPVSDDGVRSASRLLDDLMRPDEPAAAKKAPAKEAPVKEAPVKKAPVARKATPARKSAPAKKTTAAKKNAAAPQNPAGENGKTINRPRHASPSRFDTVDDE